MVVKCEICGREFKTTQGLRGHKTFVHQMTGSSKPRATSAIEQLTSTLKLLDERLSSLHKRVDKQTEQQKRLGEYIITDGAYCRVKDPRINECKHDLEQLAERYEKLSRFIQYELAGIQDDILWEVCLLRPELRSRSQKLK